MFKQILVPSLGAASVDTALELALKVAQPVEGHVEFLHVHPDARELARYASSLDLESSMFTGQIWDAIKEGDKIAAQRARKTFEDVCTEKNLGTASASFREQEGNNLECTIAAARYADLVVMGRPERPEDLTTDGTADVLIESGRPLLLAPPAPRNRGFSTVVIAWKPNASAVRAVAAAMPLLARAQKIHIVAVSERGDDEGALSDAERLAAHLRAHGLKPQAGHVRAGERDAVEVLLEAADDKLSAGLLVMGGYGHSRAREYVFGGFTRRVLHAAPLPVFMAH